MVEIYETVEGCPTRQPVTGFSVPSASTLIFMKLSDVWTNKLNQLYTFTASARWEKFVFAAINVF